MKIFTTIVVCLLFSGQVLFAQNKSANLLQGKYGGAPPGITIMKHRSEVQGRSFVTPRRVNSSLYSTAVFTFEDITIFSYFDSTGVSIVDSYGDTVGNVTMRADTIYSISPGEGIYSVSGTQPYSVLIGDAITNYINGYFALDQSGRGTSTKLNTWMMTGISWYDPHFIVFAYQDGTQYTIKELGTGDFVYAGTLNDGQFLDFPNVSTIQGKALQVVSNKPVSALSYTDQDYYVPSANGTFAGTLFYGFSGYSGDWENSITITSYTDNNRILITNLVTGDTIAVDTLSHWQVRTHGIFSDTFWKVSSTGTVTAANIPFAGWTGYYAYMARSADSTGKNIGTAFVIPTIQSDVSVFSYEDGNRVRVIELGDTTYPYASSTVIADTVLQAGGGYIFSTQYGNYVYRIQSDKNVSVVQSNSGYGADFMPLGYTLSLPDLAISQSDINFNPPDSVYKSGQRINVMVTVHNYGTAGALNVAVVAYDGDPDAGIAPPVGSFAIPSLSVEESYTGTFTMVVPPSAQYHSIYVKVDPENLITESNESNNKAFRSLKPNQDLLPPLAVTVTSPGALELQSGVLSPDPFYVEANIFNTGTVAAQNVRVQLFVYNGLSLDSGVVDTTIDSVSAQSSLDFAWLLEAKKDSSGFNLFTIRVSGSNVQSKDVNRGLLVPDVVAPATPTGLKVQLGNQWRQVVLMWNPNTEKDLAGYKIYYSKDSTNMGGGTDANEGPSPIFVSAIDTFVVTGLLGHYYFAVSAFDLSTNESPLTRQLSLTGVIETTNIPKAFSLVQNFPNPFNPSTTIKYALPAKSTVKVEVFSVLGEKVATLVTGEQPAGIHEITFNAAGLSSGIYFYRMMCGSFTSIKKMLLVK